MKSMTLFLILIQVVFLSACSSGGQVVQNNSAINQFAEIEIGRGTALYNKGCYRQSLTHFLKAHELFSAVDMLDGVAMSLNNIGNIYRIINQTESAVLFFDESFDIYMGINNLSGAVQTLSNKAAALIAGKNLNEAEETLFKAEHLAKSAEISFSPLLHNQGIILLKRKAYLEAEKTLLKALKNIDTTDFSELAAVNFALGNVMSETELHEKAISYYLSALESDRKIEFHMGIADDLAAIGRAYTALKKNRKAVNFFKRSIKAYALIGDKKNVEKILEQLDNITKNTDINTDLTKDFVRKWLSGEIETLLCE